jgi:AraC family transcriptional regulator
MKIKIEKFEPIRVAYMRHIGPYETCHETWVKFNEWEMKNNMYSPDSLVIGASWDDPITVPAEKLRYDCAISVDVSFWPDEQVQVQTLAGGDYAVYRLVGSYNEIGPTFRRIFNERLPQSGREPRMDACLEIYRTDPGKTPENENITDICVPLKQL